MYFRSRLRTPLFRASCVVAHAACRTAHCRTLLRTAWIYTMYSISTTTNEQKTCTRWRNTRFFNAPAYVVIRSPYNSLHIRTKWGRTHRLVIIRLQIRPRCSSVGEEQRTHGKTHPESNWYLLLLRLFRARRGFRDFSCEFHTCSFFFPHIREFMAYILIALFSTTLANIIRINECGLTQPSVLRTENSLRLLFGAPARIFSANSICTVRRPVAVTAFFAQHCAPRTNGSRTVRKRACHFNGSGCEIDKDVRQCMW